MSHEFHFVNENWDSLKEDDVFRKLDRPNHSLVLFRKRKRVNGFSWCLTFLQKYGKQKYEIMPKSQGHWHIVSVGNAYIAFRTEDNIVVGGLEGGHVLLCNILDKGFPDFKKGFEEYLDGHIGMIEKEGK